MKTIKPKTTDNFNKKQTPTRFANCLAGQKRSIIGSIVISILLMAALFAYRDSLTQIFMGITKVSLSDIAVSSLLSLLFFIMEGMIIYRLAGISSPDYRLRNGIATACRCEFYRLITFGSGTGIAEIHYLHKDGVAPAIGTGISVLQFVMKKNGIMLLGIVSFAFLYFSPETKALCLQYTGFLTAGCVITSAIALFLLCITLSGKVKNLVLFLLNKLALKFPSAKEKISGLETQVKLLNESGHRLFRQKKVMVQIIFYNLIKLTAIYCIPAYLLSGKYALDFFSCTMLMAAVYMLAGVIPAPSGIGSLEFVYLLLFGTFAGPEITVPALLVFRFATWILPFIAGGILCLTDKLF